MAEKKFKQIAFDRPGNLWGLAEDGHIYVQLSDEGWGRIPGPPADPVAKAELPEWFSVAADGRTCWVCVEAFGAQNKRQATPSEARAIASHLLAAADEAERGA